MINTIIFDVGMVLVDFRWKEYLKEFSFSPEEEAAVSKATFLSDEWNEFDRSLLSDEEIVRSFIQKAPEYEVQIRKVVDNIGDAIVTYDYTKPWIKELKEKELRIYILSNYPRKTYHLTTKQLDFLQLCDGALFSFEVNKIKPEPEIFQILSNRFAIHPEEAIFLDDNKKNIEMAQKLGFHTILFTTKDKAEEELNSFFKKY